MIWYSSWASVILKYGVAVVLGTILLVSVCRAGEQPRLTAEKDRESYSLGYQFGKTLKDQGMDLDLEIYVSAIKEALTAKEPRLSHEEMRETVTEVQRKAMTTRQKEHQEKAAKNLAEGQAFLDENKKKQGVTTLPSGLQYKVVKEGSGKSPNINSSVKVHYRGTLIDGTEFDNSYKQNEPATFKVGSVIRGWTEALQLMKEGTKWELYIPPGLGYGERGTRTIGPNSTLIFDVELIAVDTAQ